MRTTRTQQERVANQGKTHQLIDGYLVKIRRPRRSIRALDPWILERRQTILKNWKKYRRTQYRVKE